MIKMKPLSFAQIFPGGDLYHRVRANFERLHGEEYRLDRVFMPDNYDWPGDNEGRTMLALALTSQAVHAEPEHLEQILRKVPERLNEKGYFGKILPEGVFDEQQLSGNSWYLRSQVELYLWKREERFLERIRSVVNHLLLPARGHYRNYPCLPEERVVGGEAAGTIAGDMVRNWYLSTDIGCAFIMLDGASHAYTVLPSEPLKALLEEMIDKFLTIDLIGIKAQTHATLSALRGILRYLQTTGETKYLPEVERIYRLYRTRGMTENFANYNWFERPEWTEPCAIIDSFIVAFSLWKLTGRGEYLDDAHKIYYNGMGHAQRHNGGYGCDVCAGAGHPWLHARSDLYEATWCCTMRGGEGTARAVESTFLQDGNELTVAFYHDCTAKIVRPQGEMMLKLSTRYPTEGVVQLEVLSSTTAEPLTVRLYAPGWAEASSFKLIMDGTIQKADVRNGFVVRQLPATPGTRLELRFDIGLRWEATHNRNSMPDHVTAWHGPLLLQQIPHDGQPVVSPDSPLRPLGAGSYGLDGINDVLLRPVYTQLADWNRADAERRKRVLFPSGAGGN
jgi:hypothetical protein